MKKNFYLCAIMLAMFFTKNSYAQFQFASVKFNNQGQNNIPRISWSLPFSVYKSKISENATFVSGLVLRNEGVIFDYQGDRFKKRAISIGPSVSIVGRIGEGMIYSIGLGLDYNFHYKEKTFVDKERKQKEVTLKEWGSNRVNKINYSAKVGIGSSKGIYVYGEYFFREFLNRDFTETVEGVETKPYENLSINRFNIGIGFLLLKD